jgi:murein DD-endopeptidase MepM/ murein hydrolase activator NlpD
MLLIRLFDIIIDIYYFFQKHKKRFTCFSIEIIIVVILIACYASKDTKSPILKSKILNVEKKNDSINYLLKMAERRDSINIVELRRLPSLQPIPGKNIIAISTRYGTRTNAAYGMVRFHDGIDFAARKGTPIYADGDGIIIDSDFDNGYGNHIQIDHENGYITFYGHMNSRKVIKGQRVMRGDTIGTVGSTGVSTGYHLHYKISYKGRPVNPSIFQ